MSCVTVSQLPHVEEMYLVPCATGKKVTQKRPLGRLESQRYTPRQPVLSCNTLNIDRSGSRTYRACSTLAVLEQQQELLHDIYTKNRTCNGKQVRKSRPTSYTQDKKRQRFLTVNGTSRPWTSVERPSSVRKTEGQKPRPRTTGSHRLKRGQAKEDTHLKLDVDPAIKASSEAFHRVNQLVYSQWNPENHTLDDGIFSRSRPDGTPSSMDPKTGSQWLSFPGGDQQVSGVVEAFASVRKEQECYTVDGMVGTRVARQMTRGDKIRVGINGRLQSSNLRVKRWPKEKLKEEEGWKDEETTETLDEKTNIVPLCWTDQVSKMDAKVVQSRLPQQRRPEPNVCETTPVVFENPVHLGEEYRSRDYRVFQGKNTWSQEGFAVRTRTKRRLGIDGTDHQASYITTLTIDQPGTHGEDIDRISVEDVLEKNFTAKNQKSSAKKKPELAISNLSELVNIKQGGKRNSIHAPPPSGRSSKTEQNEENEDLSRTVSRGTGSVTPGFLSSDTRQIRPPTGHSASSIDQNIDAFVMTGSASRSGKSSSAKSAQGRTMSGKSPRPPAKPSLHKSVAAQGAGISRRGSKGDASYIQITQSLSVPRDKGPAAEIPILAQGIPPPSFISPSTSIAVDTHPLDQELNPEEFPELGLSLELEGSSTQHDPHEPDPISTDQQPLSLTPEPSHQPTDSPVSAQSQSPDIKYAFDIPTADEVEEDVEEDGGRDRSSLHDRLVEQTASLLAGAIIGADLPDDMIGPPPSGGRSNKKERVVLESLAENMIPVNKNPSEASLTDSIDVHEAEHTQGDEAEKEMTQ